jgi:hypothetical protein
MPTVQIDEATGVLMVDGSKKLFPIGFSNPPWQGGPAPSGKHPLQELRDAGGNLVRTRRGRWDPNLLDQQIAEEMRLLDAAGKHDLLCWLFLGRVARLPGPPGERNGEVLPKLVDAFKGHPALAAYKGFDEPLHNTRKNGKPAPIDPAAVARARNLIHDQAHDPNHPVVVIQAPIGKIAQLKPYADACDVTGADIFPISNPPAKHAADQRNTDISVVGDVTKKMVKAAKGKPVWMTLQIAWSHSTFKPRRGPNQPPVVPVFPTLRDERFMAYQAIVNGARGLMFFGGHMLQVCTPEDAKKKWNWTFWREALRPVVSELAALQPALTAPDAPDAITAKPRATNRPNDIELVARRADGFLYVLAVKRGSRPGADLVDFVGLPRGLTKGEVLFEYVQIPWNKPIGEGKQQLRPIKVTKGTFEDQLAPHDVHVYRFKL